MPAIRCLLVVTLAALVACGDDGKGGPDALERPQCSNGADDDGDGTIDFPEDLGCEDAQDESENSAPSPQCSDHRDNDGDGKTDYPNDPGCAASLIDDESDNCPNGAGCPQCGDGKDNDGNGTIDYPDDVMGCTSAADTVEFTDNTTACGAGMVIMPLPPNGMAMGSLSGSMSNLTSPCGGGGGVPGIAYAINLTSPKVIVASTEDPMTNFDTVLDLRAMNCSDASSEIACNDDVSDGVNKSKLTRSLKAGNYYLIVQAKAASATTDYVLDVEFFPGEGTPCTTMDDCGPELLCRIPAGQTQKVCAGPVCHDGIDDDSDGKTDYPDDPGCTSATDNTETDVCATMPTDPACPACANGRDDDMDGDIDFPDDASCLAASTVGESCPQTEVTIVATGPSTTGTTSGAVNDYRPPPGSFNGHVCSVTSSAMATAPDISIQLDLPAMTSLSLKLSPVSFDSAYILFDSTCAGTPIDCHRNPVNMGATDLAAGRYYLIVDGYEDESGAFTLLTSGTIKNGESCESQLAQSGAITCGLGYACLGTPGSRVCAATECNDANDNNLDGKTDYPVDPGCSSPNDVDEDTVCPGPSCPACSDGADNDGDTLIDYPTDTGCVTAAATNEGCPDADPVGTITTPTTTGTLVGATDDHNPSCVTTDEPDRIYTLDLPMALQRLEIDTRGSAADTVLSLMNSTCMEPSIACDDDGAQDGDSLITRGSVSPGLYSIAIDSNNSTLDTFNLNVKGTIMPGGSCEGALFQAGVLVCPPTFGCNGPAGSRTCSAAQCFDGIDNNSDGTNDYPEDPSCESTSDNSETTVCPGASCPACSDGIDNDNDGNTDYPTDTRCQAASGANEGCVDTDAITSILMPQTTGTLVGTADDHQPACYSDDGADVIYTLTVPSLQSLTIDTNGSSIASVLSFMTSDCSEPALACSTEGGITYSDSLITRSPVPAGTYTVAIDLRYGTADTYILNVRGEINPSASCESPLVATGALRCSLGFACDGPVGMRTCMLAECIDGIDNNGDGDTDFPFDPGCDSFSDDAEATVCPGPSCPICADGVDNDMDGTTDYPADPSCFSASAGNEACMQSEPVGVITQKVTTGTTANASNDFAPTCAPTWTPHTAPDLAYQLDLPVMATLELKLDASFATSHSLLDSTCGGTPIGCADFDPLTQANLAAGTYYVVIDGWTTDSGSWSLTTTGTVAPGGSCEGALFQQGAFTCTTGHVCSGTAGSRTCVPTVCNDMMDNDGDSKMDLADPGCISLDDNDEADDCFPTVGPNCPACANGIDDDMDTETDYPMDVRCPSASFFSESFCLMEADVGGQISSFSTAGTLAGKMDNFLPSCLPFFAPGGKEVSYGLRLPVPVASMQIDTIGSVSFNTTVSLWNVDCTTELACDDDGDSPSSYHSKLIVTNLAAGDYAIQVDAYGTSPSNNTGFLLNVRGTVAVGTACTDPLFASGVLACPTGTTCTGGTCQ